MVNYGFGELDTLVPAYAVTIHKSQGSEYPAVVIPVMTQHYPMLQRNLLLHRRHARPETCCARGSKEGGRHGGSQCFRATTLVKARGLAPVGVVRCAAGPSRLPSLPDLRGALQRRDIASRSQMRGSHCSHLVMGRGGRGGGVAPSLNGDATC